MGRVIHFEIHAEDPKRAAEFYGGLFGWKFTSWGDESYWLISTGPEGEAGIDGGMMKRRGPTPSGSQPMNGFVNIVDVEDVDALAERIVAAGGALAVPKTTIPGMGYSAYFKDSEGNVFGIFQNVPKAR